MSAGIPGWWWRLGGPHAITLAAWLITLPGAALAVFALTPEGTRANELAWAGIGLLAHVLSGLVLLVFRLGILADRPRPSHPWVAVAAMLAAGAARGLTVSLGSVWLGLATEPLVLLRLVSASTSLVVWFSLATLIVDGWWRHRATMAWLRLEVAREQVLADGAASVIREFRAGIIEHMQRVVTEQLTKAVGLSASAPKASVELQQIADDVIRPLGHELQHRSVDEARLLRGIDAAMTGSRMPLRAYVAGVFTERPIAPGLVAAIMLLAPSALVIGWFGPLLGVAIVAVAAGAVALGLHVLEVVLGPRLSGLPLPVRTCAVVAGWLAASGIAGLVVNHVPGAREAMPAGETEFSLGMIMAALMMAVIIGVAMEGSVAGLRGRSETLLAEAARAAEWASARLRERAWSEQRQLGRLLHGEVQARIVSLALQLQLNPPDDVAGAIAALEADLRITLTRQEAVPWRRRLERLRAVWEDSIGLEVIIDARAEAMLAHDAVAAFATAEVIGEGITNAVRHGGADHVRITVTGSPSVLALEVVDDGRQDMERGHAGMGGRMLDQACIDWTLTTIRPTTLRARIASGDLATGAWETVA